MFAACINLIHNLMEIRVIQEILDYQKNLIKDKKEFYYYKKHYIVIYVQKAYYEAYSINFIVIITMVPQ